MMKTNKNQLVMALLSSVILLCSCGNKEHEMESSAGEDKMISKIQSVEVVNPIERSFSADILITGTAEPNQKVIIYAMESGYVQNILVDIGDVVAKGAVIAELSNPELLRQLEEKEAQLDANESTYKRLSSIQEKTPALTTTQLVEDAEANYLTAKAAVSSIQDRLSFLQVKAPFGGKVTKRMIDNGALIQSGLTQSNPQGIIELQDVNPIRLTIPLPESDIVSIDKGTEVDVSFPELPGASLKAKVSRMAGALDPASKTLLVEIDLDNSDDKIKPGMYAKALVRVNSREGVISLPITAQSIFQNQPFVLVVNNDKVEQVALRKGLAGKDYFEVLNPEINANSLVIVQGKGLVKAGQIVNPVLKGE